MTPPRRAARRAVLVTVFRLVVSVGLLAVLWTRFPHVSPSDLVPRWTAPNVALLLAAAGLLLCSFALSGLRWVHMLRVLGIHTPARRALSHSFAGQFLSVVLPSSVGGDVVRVRRLGTEVGDHSGVLASVMLERLTGWLTLPLLTVVGFGINGGLRHLPRASGLALAVAVVTLVCLATLLLTAGHRGIGARCADTPGWRRVVWVAHLGIDTFRREPREGTEVLLAGLAHTLTQIGAVYLMARVLGIDAVGPTALLAFYPAVAMLQVLPVAVGGLGLREGALALFLTPLGVPTERAVALGLLLYVLTIVTSLAGAPAFALGSRRAGVRRPTSAGFTGLSTAEALGGTQPAGGRR